LVTESKIYGPLKLDVAVSHVLSNEFSHMIDQLTALSVESSISSEEGKNKLITVLKRYSAPIFMSAPVLKINNCTLVVPSGEIKLNGVFTTVGFESDDMNNEQKFFKKIQAKFYFSLPKNVVSYLFMLQMKYFLSAGNAEMDKQSADALKKVVNILLDNQLTAWKKKGYIQEKDGVLTSNLIYEYGKLTLVGIAE
ncbi:MAG: YdgA family protein, partial [Burkholderiales bacterium]|nr:YdgA family protein [Burkholderiales bacterium]